jgi:type III secretion protein C
MARLYHKQMGFCLLLLLCLGTTVWAKAPFSMPFSYYADQQDLTTALTAFARAEGLNASFSPQVKGSLSGRFDAVPPQKFLDGMRAAFGVAWYTTGSTIHFYHEKENSRAFITPTTLSAHQLKNLLQQSAVYSPELPPVLGSGGKILTLTGPPDYLAQVSGAAAALEAAQNGQMVMKVFPLKYAWAEDMTVNSMDKSITVPGVASILRAMLTGGAASPSRVEQQPATVQNLAGTGLAAVGKEPAPQAAPPAHAAAQQNATGVNIMADPRVNSVIVNDAAYRMPYYAEVIQDLDHPVELVEIHAAIVDIDADFKRELGVNLQASSTGGGPDGGWSGGGSLGSATALPAPSTGVEGLSLSTIYTNGADYFLARVRALETDGDARMLGRPSVLTVDNVQATLENTSTYYIKLEGYQAVDLFKIEAGTVLRVTPHIIRNQGKTTIKLAVSVQDDQNDNNNTTAGTIPPIKQTKINTQAIIGAGQSLLIGGYYYEKQGEDESGVPILMHIPVLGHLFKTTTKQSRRMERLILITPRVIRLDEYTTPPARVNDPSFHRSATASDYQEQIPVQKNGGCARARSVPAPASPAQSALISSPTTRANTTNTAPQAIPQGGRHVLP